MSSQIKKKPVLSVVIPVKNESGTLKYTLNTVLNQDYPAVQVIISNNSRQKSVQDLVEFKNDTRIKYVCPTGPLSFSDDWNFALDAADGDYITFLGQDDGIIPGALNYGMNLIHEHNISALTWRKLNYNWPNHIRPEARNVVEGLAENRLQLLKGDVALKLLSRFRFGYDQLPCIYNSIVKKDIIDRIRIKSTGNKFFSGVIPDVYSGIVLATEVKDYLYIWFSLTVNGASDKSSGVMQGLKKLNDDQKSQISDALSSGTKYHKDIGPFSSSIASITLGEYFLAKSVLTEYEWPEPSWRAYISYVLREARGSKNHPSRLIKAAEYTAKARKIYRIIPKHLKSIESKPSNHFNGRVVLPEELVSNVESASNLFQHLLPEKVNIDTNSNLILARNWISHTITTAANIYRNIKFS